MTILRERKIHGTVRIRVHAGVQGVFPGERL